MRQRYEQVCPACHTSIVEGPEPAGCPTCGLDLKRNPPVALWAMDGEDIRRACRAALWLLILPLLTLPIYGLAYGLIPVTIAGASAFVEVLQWTSCILSLVLTLAGLPPLLTMMRAMGYPPALRVIATLLTLIPCLSQLTLMGAGLTAAARLRDSGLRAWPWNVADDDLLYLGQPFACTKCGYSLIGNTSGVCPECGTPTARRG